MPISRLRPILTRREFSSSVSLPSQLAHRAGSAADFSSRDVPYSGGGDGGVLREVLKHPSVKEATLCDIDEAVPRVSKQFLPHMAAGFNDPRVTVHIGDGFKFLHDRKGQFDVIITDSSDPVGPANSLFEKPYFVLLQEALRDGGHISTQGECIWLHLPLITNLLHMTRGLFPVAEYAYTSIPTYPSGTIGFVVCSKDGSHNVKKPLRKVDNCRYYNEKVHEAAFVLPTFADQAAKAAGPARVGGAAAEAISGGSPKKILLLGSGFVAQPCAEYVLRRSENSLTIGKEEAGSRVAAERCYHVLMRPPPFLLSPLLPRPVQRHRTSRTLRLLRRRSQATLPPSRWM